MTTLLASLSSNISQKLKQSRTGIHLRLPYDILVYIFEHLEGDQRTLYQCLLLNWETKSAALASLYRSVVFEPAFWYGYQDKDIEEEDCPALKAACLPQHGRFVRQFEVRGFLSLSSSSRNQEILTNLLSKCIRSFPNLRTATFTPKSHYPSLFSGALQALGEGVCPYFKDLVLDESGLTENNAGTLLGVSGLRKLVLQYPSAVVTKAFEDGWLATSSETLTELHFEGVCLLITPLVLNSEVRNLQNVEVFGLGLVEEGPDDPSLYSFLESLPRLHTLALYYNEEQHPDNERQCRLHQLRSFTVRYFGPQSQSDIDRLCGWISGVIEGSPRLEELCLIDDNGESINNLTQEVVLAQFDLLVDYIATKRRSLRRLQMPNGFLGRSSLELLRTNCSQLEDLSVATNKVTLMNFARSPNTGREASMLRRATLNLRRRTDLDDTDLRLSQAEATTLVEKFPKLQSFVVNKHSWEVCWIRLDCGQLVKMIVPKATRQGQDM